MEKIVDTDLYIFDLRKGWQKLQIQKVTNMCYWRFINNKLNINFLTADSFDSHKRNNELKTFEMFQFCELIEEDYRNQNRRASLDFNIFTYGLNDLERELGKPIIREVAETFKNFGENKKGEIK